MTSASCTTQNRIDKKETTLHLRGKFVKYLYQSQYNHSQERIPPQVLSHVIRFTQYRYLYFFYAYH